MTAGTIAEADARSRQSRKSAPAVAAPAEPTTAKRTSLTPVAATEHSPALHTVAARPGAPLVAAVSLNAQTVTIYSGTDVLARSPISSGMNGFATPTGVFSIIQKARYHESNLYENAPMPFMQRLTWSGVAFHAGRLPGYPASHGCVRLPDEFAERLFGMLKMGTRVVVAPEVVSPVPIQHAALPKPLYTAVTAADRPEVTRASGGLTLASVGEETPARERMLPPPQWADHEKRLAQLVLADAHAGAKRRFDAARQSAVAADDERAARERIEREIASFRNLLTRAHRQRDTATDSEGRIQALASIYAFEDAILDATEAAAQLKTVESELLTRSFADARAARQAEDDVEKADAAAKIAARGSEPITVFVSRADSRVQLRQGFHTILSGDVHILDPQMKLGTHVLTAGPVRSIEDGLSWTGVSISDGGVRGPSAAEALSRIAFDPEIAEAIGRRTWSGTTLLISDQPASKETGKGTDFVILTR